MGEIAEFNPFFPVDLKEIRALIELMHKHNLAVFKMEREDFSITLKTADAKSLVIPTPTAAIAHPPSIPATLKASEIETPTEEAKDKGKAIVSPMVGTFYAAPSPEAPPFVEVGKQVTPETVVCIIEAMKVMNEIKAEISGTITEVVAKNGEPVQFDQVLFRVK